MNLKNTIIHLIGYSGVGKYTIAKELAALTDAKIIDNHLINNPVFSVLDANSGEYPTGIWRQIDLVRDAVLTTIKNFSPPEYSFVFTHALMDGEEKYQRILDLVMNLAKDRDALYVPVRLICDTEENVKRIVQPQREERLKPTNPDRMLGHRAAKELISIPHTNLLDLNVTPLSAHDAANEILKHINQLEI